MKICVVSLDLHHPPQAYQVLDSQLQRLNFHRLQSHLWAAAGELTPQCVKATVVSCLQPEDGVFVFSQESAVDDYASHNPLK